MQPRVTLDQWLVFATVIDAGGYAHAAEKLHRSQSAISYSMTKLQQLLGVDVMRIQGRKAVLTPSGEVLLRHARQLLLEAARIEQLGHALEQGWEAEVRLTVEALLPSRLLHEVLKRFSEELPDTQLQLAEETLSGVDEALIEQRTDLAISPGVPVGFLGSPLLDTQMVAVAAPDHPLHQIGRELHLEDLAKHRQVVVRDSGSKAKRDAGWLGATSRWTVSSMRESVSMLREGLGYGWIPDHLIKAELGDGRLKQLDLTEGGIRQLTLYLIYRDKEMAGPACRRLAEIFKQAAAAYRP